MKCINCKSSLIYKIIEFKKIKIGTMSFKKGLSKLKLKTTKKVGKKSIDFRLLILKNENEKNS